MKNKKEKIVVCQGKCDHEFKGINPQTKRPVIKCNGCGRTIGA